MNAFQGSRNTVNSNGIDVDICEHSFFFSRSFVECTMFVPLSSAHTVTTVNGAAFFEMVFDAFERSALRKKPEVNKDGKTLEQVSV